MQCVQLVQGHEVEHAKNLGLAHDVAAIVNHQPAPREAWLVHHIAWRDVEAAVVAGVSVLLQGDDAVESTGLGAGVDADGLPGVGLDDVAFVADFKAANRPRGLDELDRRRAARTKLGAQAFGRRGKGGVGFNLSAANIRRGGVHDLGHPERLG